MVEEEAQQSYHHLEEPTELQMEEKEEPECEEEDGNEEENEAEDEEEEGEEEDDNGYIFRFEGEMNPLVFTEDDDASGLSPYQHFERLEHQYEALAAKKRKASALDCEFSTKRLRQDDGFGASMEEIMEAMNYGMRRKRKHKKRGRKKGSKKKVDPEVTRKLGDAILCYADGRYMEAIGFLKEVIRLSPDLPDPYDTLGLIYSTLGYNKRAFNFYMLAAHLTPKDSSLWKRLFILSMEQGDKKQASYCISKAITADPKDIDLQFDRGSLYLELGDIQRAAGSYEQICRLCPDSVEALRNTVQLYQRCGQHECAVRVLDNYFRSHPTGADLGLVNLFAKIHMEGNDYLKALELIEHAQQAYYVGKEMPLCLLIKAGICHLHLGHLEKAEAIFSTLQGQHESGRDRLFVEVADSLISLQYYESALKYYMMVPEEGDNPDGYLYLKIAQCYFSLKESERAIEYFHKAVQRLNDNVNARLTLSSLLLEKGKDDEAISVLSPPDKSDSLFDQDSDKSKQWWLNGKIKLKLCQIYKAKGSLEAFVDVIFPVVRETLFVESVREKVKVRRRLSRSVLHERLKILGDGQTDTVFQGFRPVASASDLSKAARARKLLKKKETQKEAKRAAAIAAGVDWQSDDSEDESPKPIRDPPLPNLLKEEEHLCLILDLCKALLSLQRYWEALDIVNLSLKLACDTLTPERKEELRTLGAQIAYNTADPTHGFDCARYIVNQRPYSFSAWSCYYKVVSKLGNRYSKHNKFLNGMRTKHKDSVPPMLISGHQFTMIKQHQIAASEYLEAYKLMPESHLINLCAGTALINLALDHRLQNKHQSIIQGLSFLYNNLHLDKNSQEALYNIGRACHHVGLVSLAVKCYEKVLTMHESDYPVPKLPNESQDMADNPKPGYCDLRREAAYNLHLIYKNSGALDLARQVLKDHCVL